MRSGNVIPLPFSNFEVAIGTISSSINDSASLKNSLRRFLSSPEIIASLSREQAERLFSLFPLSMKALASSELKSAVDKGYEEAVSKIPKIEWPNKVNDIIREMFDEEDRRDEAQKTTIAELGARAEDYALFVPTRFVMFLPHIDVIESFFQDDNPFKYMSRFLRRGLHSRHHSYGTIETYRADKDILSEFLKDLASRSSSSKIGKTIAFFQKYATGQPYELSDPDGFETDVWREIDFLELSELFKKNLKVEITELMLDSLGKYFDLDIKPALYAMQECLRYAGDEGRVPTWNRVTAATTPGYVLVRGNIQGMLLHYDYVLDDKVYEETKLILKQLERDQVAVGLFSIEWLNETGFSFWELPYEEPIDVPVLDFARCIAGTPEGCTNANFVDAVLDHYKTPQFYRHCDALIALFLLRYLSQWTGRRTCEASDFSPGAAIRMLLGHLSLIPNDYRRFSPRMIQFLSHIVQAYGGPQKEIFRLLMSVVHDDGPALPIPATSLVTKELAEQQLRRMVVDEVWETLDRMTRNDLIAAEMAWLEIANILFKWPIEESPHQAACVQSLCRAFERQLRGALRRAFEEAHIRWRDVFRSETPSFGQICRTFLPSQALSTNDQTRFEGTELCRFFSNPVGLTLSEVVGIRNKAAHGAESSAHQVSPADVIVIRDFVFIKGALAAAARL
jgi:hypothetical protein